MKTTRRSIQALGLTALLAALTTTGCGSDAANAADDATSVLGVGGSDATATGERDDVELVDGGAAPDGSQQSSSASEWAVLELDDEAFAADPLAGIVIPAGFDAPLTSDQRELLALASQAAEAIPHDKPRAVAEESVAVTALRLDAPSLAYEYARRVENWRKGSLIADLAMHFVDRDEVGLAERLAERAFRIARGTEAEDPQSWRRARIAAKAGHVYVRVGRLADAANLLEGIQSPDMGIVDNARVKTMSDADFDQYLASVELATQAGDLELVVHTFGSCVELMDRFWMDGTRRERLEAVMRGYWSRMPIPERLKLIMRLADVAVGKEDAAAALGYLDEAQGVVDSTRWLPRHLLPVQAELAVMRFNAGDEAGGRSGLRTALSTYDTEWVDMTDIWRAGALRPVAEGFDRTGDAEQAALVYARVLEDGNVNPNVKPRAEDLAATCCSMALFGFEPDEAAWARMRELRVGLAQPL